MVDRMARTGHGETRPLERKAGGQTKVMPVHPGFRVESGGWVDVFMQAGLLEER